jgi:AcrR family transcriptional regulator
MPGNGSHAAVTARREEHADDTRRALLAAARRAFAQKGYAATSLEDIVGPARLTKGALYHHFTNKAAVLEALYIEMSEQLLESVTRAVIAAGNDVWAKLVAALEAFFDASTEPEYVRIVLREAPHVLGSHGRDLDQSIGLAFVSELVAGLQKEGLMPALPVAMTARVLLATTGEIATTMADASDPVAARREGTAVLMAMLEGLRDAAAPRRRSRR